MREQSMFERFRERKRLLQTYDVFVHYGTDFVFDRGPIGAFRRRMQQLLHRPPYKLVPLDPAVKVRLMLQELVLGQGPPRAAGPTIARAHAALAALVSEGQADGSIRAGDPALLAIGVLSHPLHLVLIGGALKTVLGLDLDDPGERARVLDHAAAFARAALAARAEGGS